MAQLTAEPAADVSVVPATVAWSGRASLELTPWHVFSGFNLYALYFFSWQAPQLGVLYPNLLASTQRLGQSLAEELSKSGTVWALSLWYTGSLCHGFTMFL